MDTTEKTTKPWRDQEALHRHRLIAPLLAEDLDDARRVALRLQYYAAIRQRIDMCCTLPN